MRRLIPATGLWRHADFLKLWSAETISRFGSEFSGLALPIVAVIVLDVSAFKVALLATIEFLPFIIFTLPAGVWVDRLPRRPILVAGDLGRASGTGLDPARLRLRRADDLAALRRRLRRGHRHGLLRRRLPVVPTLARRARPARRGKLEARGLALRLADQWPRNRGRSDHALDRPLAILLDAISFVLSALFLFRIRKTEVLPAREGPRRGPFEGMGGELREGLRFVLGHPHLRAITACTGISNFFGQFMFSILIVYAVREVGLGVGTIGLILTLSNFGFLAGALSANKISARLGVGRTIISSAFLFGPALLLVPLAPDGAEIPFFVAAFALVGFSAVIYNITQVSYRQAICPERLQGRMNSVVRFVVWGVIPLGSLSGGAVATVFGLRAAIWTGAIGGFFAFLPLVFSSLNSLQRLPEPEEELLPSEAAAAGGIAIPAVGIAGCLTSGRGAASGGTETSSASGRRRRSVSSAPRSPGSRFRSSRS